MKAIILHTASTDNSGARRVAGTELKVGAGKDQIDADRAKALVAKGLGVEASAPAKPAVAAD